MLRLLNAQEYQKAFAFLNRRLKPMESTAASSPAEFQNLCYLLTCKVSEYKTRLVCSALCRRPLSINCPFSSLQTLVYGFVALIARGAHATGAHGFCRFALAGPKYQRRDMHLPLTMRMCWPITMHRGLVSSISVAPAHGPHGTACMQPSSGALHSLVTVVGIEVGC